jgi:hypothetical protein
MKWVSLAAAAVSAVSCDPRRFDDLEDSAWVQFADRNDSQASGTLGFDIAAVPVADGKKGARFVVASNSPAGLSLVTFDENGSLSDQLGRNALATSGGQLAPLNSKAAWTQSLTSYPGNFVLVGQPDQKLAAKLDVGLTTGNAVGTSQDQYYGLAIAVGDLGSGATAPDIAIVSQLALTIVSGKDGKQKTCGIKSPNQNMGVTVPLGNVLIAPIKKNGHNQIILTGRVLSGDVPKILVIEPGDIVDTMNCPETGFSTGVSGEQPAVSLAIGDFDGTPGLDLVAGFNPQTGGKAGSVLIYPNISDFANPASMAITTPADDGPSPLYGSRLRIANLDDDATPELIVGDATSPVNNVSQAGRVWVYKATGCGDLPKRGPVCVMAALSDPSPSTNDLFGEAIAASPFPTADATKNVLAVGEKNRVWVYFRVTATNDKDLRANRQ